MSLFSTYHFLKTHVKKIKSPLLKGKNDDQCYLLHLPTSPHHYSDTQWLNVFIDQLYRKESNFVRLNFIHFHESHLA